MRDFKPFDILQCPLEGTHLIEASAGTGKTYTIAGLFLRLVLEKGLSVQQVLVVTFTEAATAELKEKIRSRLRDALSALIQGGGSVRDAFIKAMADKYHGRPEAPIMLRQALRDFDKAAIFTIHGFCRRMLQENAFESGTLFDTELITDQEDLKREVVEDFWRRHFYGASPLFVSYALGNGFSPENLASLISNWVSLPYVRIIPRIEVPDTAREEKAFKAAFTRAKEIWGSSRDEVWEILLHDQGLNRVKYGGKRVRDLLDQMDAWLSFGPDPFIFKGFEKFTTEELERSVKRGYSPPRHPFFDAASRLRIARQRLEDGFQKRLIALKSELFSFVKEELERRKAQRNVQFFDDLLSSLSRALQGEAGNRFARFLSLKFKTALIDEFQDTDPVQYDIFKKIFSFPGNGLFLIGDPKQAIYGFRGADIFTYMKASQEAASRYTLERNWRSDPKLVKAVNTLFGSSKRPFVFETIRFQEISPAEREDPELLSLEGGRRPPLQVWFLNPVTGEEARKPLSKEKARDWIARAVAAEISRLLRLGREGKALIGSRPLGERDIAVLVRRNSEARLVKGALSRLGIPSVLYAGGNLFETREAEEVERVLTAVADPNSEGHLRAALLTEILGLNGDTLERMGEENLEEWMVRFREYRLEWSEKGFMRMFRHLLIQNGVLGRLMAYEDGERRMTNLFHLAEVLHQAEMEKKLRASGLLKWLKERREGGGSDREEHPLRLESDENAVKLVTIHKSKGLEYPVVFCPFQWDGSTIKKTAGALTFHDPSRPFEFTLDLGSDRAADNRAAAEKEVLAENLRLLYVAVTRARYRCYLVWGAFNEAETSAPAYLFHFKKKTDEGDPVGALKAEFPKLVGGPLREDLETLEKKSDGSICLFDVPEDVQGERVSEEMRTERPLECRSFSGRIERRWGLTSFSSMVSGRAYGEDSQDRDPVKETTPDREEKKRAKEGEEKKDIFSFPAGARSGTFFHDLLEHLDYSRTSPEGIRALVLEKLAAYGFDAAWEETVSSMIRKVLSVSLDGKDSRFTLSSVGREERLNELEFYFPLKTVDPHRLRNLLEVGGAGEFPPNFPENTGRLEFSPVKGYMRGFIDLVLRHGSRFFIVDWKSNHLGDEIEDYGPEGLSRAMEEGMYTLQYLIYTLALHQYLGLRLPGYEYERHFGGIFYVFIRGVDPEKGAEFGVFRARPSHSLVEELRRGLIEEE
ncbi:MAG: exodeoxyribonuclease V subunit beta [Deltaproteobacteria bacterium]|nr:exodeoxyribonuclease V subunit beta [Deltaproteobacteria bacterium]MBW2130141.1 exodeoxyribonuclease V subunit beta [Deltaproteobacteria bacterium]